MSWAARNTSKPFPKLNQGNTGLSNTRNDTTMIDVQLHYRGQPSERRKLPGIPAVGSYIMDQGPAGRLWRVDSVVYDGALLRSIVSRCRPGWPANWSRRGPRGRIRAARRRDHCPGRMN